MVRSINLRLCSKFYIDSDYWKKQGKPHYHFERYDAELRTSKSKKWGKEMLSIGDGATTYATAGGSLEEIAHKVLLFEHYNKMIHPSYEFSLWEGIHPEHKILTSYFTKIPEKHVIGKLSGLFDEYYQIKELVSQNCYEEAYERISKSRIDNTFFVTIKDEPLRRFYIGLRKNDKEKATKMAKKFFPLNFYYELETAFLHNLEGEQTRGKSRLRGPEIIFAG